MTKQLDFVHIEDFTKETDQWLKQKFKEYFGNDTSYQTFENGAAMFFILRATDEEEFPGGKWATIARLEFLVDQAIRND